MTSRSSRSNGVSNADGAAPSQAGRTFDALPDTVDFRDQLFVPTLIRVAPQSDLDQYRNYGIPVLDQGKEGACTGFGLATVANYLLRVRGGRADADPVSAWMLYRMAKRYDEWPGEDYEGSSARGAMKGWFKHGLCSEQNWSASEPDPATFDTRNSDALGRPLGAYFRVNHKDLVAMHAAINEVGILFATASVHKGWQRVGAGDTDIRYDPMKIGGHAFAIVGYDQLGLWIQNSWGTDWGSAGLIRLSYGDWLANGSDVWVASLGVPINLVSTEAAAMMRAGAPRSHSSQIYADLRPHVIPSANGGQLDQKGTYGVSETTLRALIGTHLPKVMRDWPRKRVLLYAHGGMVSEDAAIQTLTRNLDPVMKSEIYPLAFIWRSDIVSTLSNIVKDALSTRRSEGILEDFADYMIERLDDTIEVGVRNLGGKAIWDEMKENADLATSRASGSARITAEGLADAFQKGLIEEIHLVGHSAGSNFLAPMTELLAGSGVKIASLSLWAPACTIALFDKVYRPLIESGAVQEFDLYTLDERTELNDNCASIYQKSLLYLVRNALEVRPRIAARQDGTPLLGLECDAKAIDRGFWAAPARRWLKAPGQASNAMRHGDFNDDERTLESTLRRITGKNSPVVKLARAKAPSHEAARELGRAIRRAAYNPQ